MDPSTSTRADITATHLTSSARRCLTRLVLSPRVSHTHYHNIIEQHTYDCLFDIPDVTTCGEFSVERIWCAADNSPKSSPLPPVVICRKCHLEENYSSLCVPVTQALRENSRTNINPRLHPKSLSNTTLSGSLYKTTTTTHLSSNLPVSLPLSRPLCQFP